MIRSNTAANAGGGVYGGSDIYEDNSLFRDCVIAGNEAGQGSQIALVGDGGGDVDTLTLTESAVEGGVKSIYIPGDQWLLFWGDGNTTLIPADLVSANVAFGTLISGGLAELRASDDLRLRARSGAGFAASEPNLIDLRIAAENIVNDPALMQIAIEARLNNPNGTARVRLRNWQAGQFEVIHIYSVGQSEATETIQNIPAASFVRSDDDQIELSIRMSTVATFSVQGFDAFFDLVEIRLE